MGQAPPFSPPLSLLSEAPAVPRTSDSEKSSLDWRYYLLVQAQEEGEEVKRRTSSQEGNKDSFYGICANKVPKLRCKHEPPENIWSECPSTALRRQRVGTNADMQNSYWLLQRGSVPLLCFTLVNTYSTLRYTHLSLKQKYRYSQYWFMLWCKRTYWNAEWNRWNNKWYCRNKNS